MADDPPRLHLKELKAISVLGHGAKGLVFLVLHRTSGSRLALKVISTTSSSPKNGTKLPLFAHDDLHRRILFERDVLASLHHPLLPTLRAVVSTEKIIGFAIDHCPGGNLTSLRKRQTDQMFSEDVIRFYAAELVITLEHLHGLAIVYRDLKPENILIQSNGHLMLVDYDLSTSLPAKPTPGAPHPPSPPPQMWHYRTRSWNSNDSWYSSSSSESSSSMSSAKSNSFVGTEEYVAPEIVEGTGHDYAVDWWSLGVVMYEMLYGRTPFRGQNRRETFYQIVRDMPVMPGERTALRELIGRMLEKDPRRRICLEGIKAHPFFKGMDWGLVVEVSRPPFIPVVSSDEDEEEGGCGGGEGEGIDVEEWVRRVFQGKEEGSGGGGRGEETGRLRKEGKDHEFLGF